MKLRIRNKTKTLSIELDNLAPFDHLLSTVKSVFQLGTDFLLSLNNKTPIECSVEHQQTLTELGIVSGDLVYIISSSATLPSAASCSLSSTTLNCRSSINSGDQHLTVSFRDGPVLNSVVDTVTSGNLLRMATTEDRKDSDNAKDIDSVDASSAAITAASIVAGHEVKTTVCNCLPMDASSDAYIDLPLDTTGVLHLDSSGAAVNTDGRCLTSLAVEDDEGHNCVQVNHYLNEPMLVCNATEAGLPKSLVSAFIMAQPHSQVAALLVTLDVLMSELGYQRTTMGKADDMIDWHMTKGETRLYYVYPPLPGTEFKLLCVPMCNILMVHGNVHLGAGSDAEGRKLQLRVSEYVNAGAVDTDIVTNVYKTANLSQLSRLFKDNIACPLLQLAYQDSDEAAVESLDVIFFELKIHIFLYLDAKSLVRLSAVSRHLRDVSRKPLLWRRLFIKDFGIGVNDMSDTQDWISLYKAKYTERLNIQRRKREIAKFFAAQHPHIDRPMPSPFDPFPFSWTGIVGGENDLRPIPVPDPFCLPDPLRHPRPLGPDSLFDPSSPLFDQALPQVHPTGFTAPPPSRHPLLHPAPASFGSRCSFNMRFI